MRDSGVNAVPVRRSGRAGPRQGAGLGALALLLAVSALVAGCTSDGTLVGSASPSSAAAGAAPAGGSGAGGDGSALKLLATLPVRAEDNSPKYVRSEFGTPWSDVDHNHCDTRNDILHRDLRSTTIRKSDDCTVLTGELVDPYTTRIIRFDRSRNASAVQIDHVVPLADAWRTGALDWTDAQRLQFANDPENLLAVDGPTNIRKSDQDASEWLPPSPGAQCAYVARQVGLKSRYHLWVIAAEAAAMRTVLQKCPTQPALALTAPN
ncbi:HNH endonuclease family protein [Frankia sp. AgKG'84/4]|uniref:HNH endonuclease family protein n=1 Tax=Frankia sp. AgKG'84/4 TaxID=573490 RepID=UPI00200E7B31|nr:HNH endonuclease family protein [Frankia sp. AgKG'84/4]MCL9796349.1 HNH endonuclease family protein [Frankia sp. AgKG'84/4]